MNIHLVGKHLTKGILVWKQFVIMYEAKIIEHAERPESGRTETEH